MLTKFEFDGRLDGAAEDRETERAPGGAKKKNWGGKENRFPGNGADKQCGGEESAAGGMAERKARTRLGKQEKSGACGTEF